MYKCLVESYVLRKLVIITPTIGRNNLIRTCNSINEQSFKNWEHIILFDNVSDEKINNLLTQIPYEPTIIKGIWNNYGNGQRFEAWEYTDINSIITYIDDDDDYYNNKVFQKIIDKFSSNSTLDAVFWPGLRYGKIFFNKPPQSGKTMSNQFAHKKYDKDKNPIRWPFSKNNNKNYAIDGEFINYISNNLNYDYIEGEPLVVVPKSNYGK